MYMYVYLFMYRDMNVQVPGCRYAWKGFSQKKKSLFAIFEQLPWHKKNT